MPALFTSASRWPPKASSACSKRRRRSASRRRPPVRPGTAAAADRSPTPGTRPRSLRPRAVARVVDRDRAPRPRKFLRHAGPRPRLDPVTKTVGGWTIPPIITGAARRGSPAFTAQWSGASESGGSLRRPACRWRAICSARPSTVAFASLPSGRTSQTLGMNSTPYRARPSNSRRARRGSSRSRVPRRTGAPAPVASTESPRITTSGSFFSDSQDVFRKGRSCLHGPHQVAQKSSRTYLPRRSTTAAAGRPA